MTFQLHPKMATKITSMLIGWSNTPKNSESTKLDDVFNNCLYVNPFIGRDNYPYACTTFYILLAQTIRLPFLSSLIEEQSFSSCKRDNEFARVLV